MLGAGLSGRFDVDGEGNGVGTVRGSRSGAGLQERLWGRERGDVDPAGHGLGTPGGARSGAFLKVLQAPSANSQEANAGIGGGAFSLLSAPTGRLDLDGEGYGLGTPRGSRSGAGLVLSRVPLPGQSQAESAPLDFASLVGPASRASLTAPRGRLDVDAEGYGLGTPRGSRSGAGLFLSVAPPASLLESRPSSAAAALAELNRCGRVASLGAPRGRYDVDGEGYGLGTPRGSRSGAGLVLLVQQQPQSILAATEGSLGEAICLAAPRGRLDVDGEGYGLGTPRGSRSGAGLALLRQAAGVSALATAPPPPVAPLMSGAMLSAPYGRRDVDAEGYGTGTPRGSRSGAGLAFVGYAPVYVAQPRG